MILFLRMIIVLLSFLFAIDMYAQHTEPVLLNVHYRLIHFYDKDNKSLSVQTEKILRIGKTNAMFSNAPKTAEPKKIASGDNTQLPVSGKRKIVSGSPVIAVLSKEKTNETIFQLPSENQLIIYQILGFKEYKIELPYSKIDWDIKAESRMIGGYNCLKAIGNFGGRIYSAWFAPELPFQYGPWKLGGLPGLILEARDELKEVIFSFAGIEKPGEYEFVKSDAYRPEKVKAKEFEKAKAVYDKDPIAFSQAQFPGNTIEMIMFTDTSGKVQQGEAARSAIKENQKKRITNPIEKKS